MRAFDQHPIVHPGPWGYRDGTNDGTLLYFGNEDGIFSHNPDGSNAQQVIAGAGPNGNYRALAYDPTGDGGNGSFWSANFDSSLVEVSRTGGTHATRPGGRNARTLARSAARSRATASRPVYASRASKSKTAKSPVVPRPTGLGVEQVMFAGGSPPQPLGGAASGAAEKLQARPLRASVAYLACA